MHIMPTVQPNGSSMEERYLDEYGTPRETGRVYGLP